MITLFWWEFLGWSVIMVLLGFGLWDLFWTVLLPDAKAIKHFARASWKNNVALIAVIALTIVAIIGFFY